MDDLDKDPRQIELIDYIEDAEAHGPSVVDPAKCLTNDQLESGGLVAVKAFVRTKSTRNAISVQKSAEKRARGETGEPRRQLNLQAPVDDISREALKRVNTALLEHKITIEDLDALSGDQEAIDWRTRALTAERELAALRQRRAWWRFWRR